MYPLIVHKLSTILVHDSNGSGARYTYMQPVNYEPHYYASFTISQGYPIKDEIKRAIPMNITAFFVPETTVLRNLSLFMLRSHATRITQYGKVTNGENA